MWRPNTAEYGGYVAAGEGQVNKVWKTDAEGNPGWRDETVTPEYSLPLAASGTRGGIQIGYTQSENNYPVELSNEKAYVNVPWTDTKVTSVENHYTPIAVDSAKLTAIAKNGPTRWNTDVVQTIEVFKDAKGHVTDIGVSAVKIPANPNTDYQVAQNNKASENVDYRLLLSYSNSDATEIKQVNKNSNLTYNPFNNLLSTGNLQLTGELNITGNAYLHNQTSAGSLTAGSLLVTGPASFTQTPTAPTAAEGTNDTQLATTAFVKNSIASLSTAMHFIGKATVAITDGSTTNPTITGYDFTADRKPGDVIVDKDNAYEYVWTYEGKWERLGPDGSYKVTQSAVDTGAAVTNKWVSRIQQNANGVITATMGTLDTSGTWSGNAATATKLQTARTINGTNFDGSANITTANWGTARTLTIGNKGQSVNGSGNITWNLQDVLIRGGNEFNYTADGIAGLWFNHKSQTGTNTTTKITSYTFGNGQRGYSGVQLIAESFSGTAAKATADGSGNNIVNTYLTKAAGVTNVAWDNTNKKLTKTINGTTSDIVAVTVNNPTLAWNTESVIAKIGTVDVKVKLPANPNTNTDTLVKQTAKSDNVNYKILMTTSASPTSGNAAEVAYDGNITINPSTNTITATNFAGNAATATKLATARKLKVALGSTTDVTFDGSADQTSIPISGTLGIANGGTGKTTAAGIYEVVRDNGGDSRWVNVSGDTMTGTLTFNYNEDSALIKNTYNSTAYNLIRNHNNGNISINASSGDLYLGYENTSSIKAGTNLLPKSANAYTIGANDKEWKAIYSRSLFLQANTARYGDFYIGSIGTANSGENNETRGAQGEAVLRLGNNITRPAAGTAGGANNARGKIRVYDESTSYTDIMHGSWTGAHLSVVGNTGTAAGTTGSSLIILGNNKRKSAEEASSTGRIRIFGDEQYYHDIYPSAKVANYAQYLPKATGWIAVGGDGISSGVGGADQIVYLNAAGVLKAGTSATNANTANTIVKRDASGNFSAGTITATLSGNATTSTRANITTNTNGVAYYTNTTGTFGNIRSAPGAFYSTGQDTKPTFGTLPVAQGGTGITSNPSMLTDLGSTTAKSVFVASPRPGVTGTLKIGNGGTGATTAADARANLGTMGAKTVNGYDGLMTMAGSDANWIRTTSAGLIPYETGGLGSGHCSLGTSTWYFSNLYVDSIHTGNIIQAQTGTNNRIYGFKISATKNSNTNTDYYSQIIFNGDNNDSDWSQAGGHRWGTIEHRINTSSINQISLKVYKIASGSTEGKQIYIKYNRSTSAYEAGSEAPFYGAVWNDYAEYRETKAIISPGRCIIETGKGDLVLATERLQPGAEIVSDTFGFAIGQSETCKTPTAATGRVLAYPLEPREIFKAGDAVCSGPGGTVSRMTREEIREWPDRIIGTVSEIPEYTVWYAGHEKDTPIQVNGRIWIRIR